MLEFFFFLCVFFLECQGTTQLPTVWKTHLLVVERNHPSSKHEHMKSGNWLLATDSQVLHGIIRFIHSLQ